MSLLYSDKLKYSQIMRDKFSEIKKLKFDLIEALDNEDKEQYEYMVNVIFGKISVIETSIVNLKKEFLEKKDS